MRKPAHVIEIFLQPGELYFGDRDTRIRTILGSCVSITLWHPHLLIGGMCHYILPIRHGRNSETEDGKYADEAFSLLVENVKKSGTALEEYQVKLFGGGNMFPSRSRTDHAHIGIKNAEAGKRLVRKHGLRSLAEHLGGCGHRTVIFDVWSGNVWVRQLIPNLPGRCDNCEINERCLHE